MPFDSSQITLVADTPTPLLVQGTGGGNGTFKNITGTIQDPVPVQIQNLSAATVYLGGPGVSDSNGYPLAENEAVVWNLYNNDIPYAYSTGTPTVAVICGRQ